MCVPEGKLHTCPNGDSFTRLEQACDAFSTLAVKHPQPGTYDDLCTSASIVINYILSQTSISLSQHGITVRRLKRFLVKRYTCGTKCSLRRESRCSFTLYGVSEPQYRSLDRCTGREETSSVERGGGRTTSTQQDLPQHRKCTRRCSSKDSVRFWLPRQNAFVKTKPNTNFEPVFWTRPGKYETKILAALDESICDPTSLISLLEFLLYG